MTAARRLRLHFQEDLNGVCAVPLLDKRAVNEAVEFDLLFGIASMRTLLDTLIIGALGIDLGRLRNDHIRDLVVGEIFTVRRAWGMSPIQIVLYLEGSTTSGHAQ